MKPATHTVQELFERDVRYIVPLYQRPYVWNEEEQWGPLWQDITALLHHQEDTGGLGNYAQWSHFLGAIVLDQEQTAPGRIPRFTVIDGQQRLTTLQLLVAAAAKAMTEVGADNDAEILRELISNNPRKAKGTDLLKVWPTNANREAFVAVMSADGPPPGRRDDPSNLIDEAFDYFTTQIGNYLRGGDDEDPDDRPVSERAEQLRITLCDLLKVVSITLEPGDNAQVIFETLNARGTPLLSLDLVKNAVFRLATNQSHDTDALYEHVWRPQLDDDYWRQKRRQGRLNRPTGELFLMHWLTMRLGNVIPATELFATFNKRVLTGGVDAKALINELCSDAAVMRSFDEFPAESPEGRFFARLTLLDAGTVLPIVLLLFRSPEVSTHRRRRALHMLESWLARRALMRMTAKNYNRLIPTLVGKLKENLEHADDALHAGLAGSAAMVSRWPDDEELRDFLMTRDVYGTVSQPRIVMALAAVEESLRAEKSEHLPSDRKLTLEHLLPQDWKTHWPLPDSASPSGEDARAARLHRLGNLTIVTHPLNAAMSNSDWKTKRAALNQHSVLLLNSRLSRREEWNEEAIDERGEWLAQRLIDIWPGPDAPEWK
ncbi:DUF262 domain-containing protein [Saccharomonospora cyanea]|uniref:DUF262 domain-containing protein n=1 Tax=Saccharomonospora cyanea NA-134 TaxID=882082 RepID=H5XD23_9PSEU|nr:DUF262 domain-containing protein [Saccharomonospora cyanea]EHR63454.1 hypothetical protein SaccyDRAFT_4647 [Saccharomonospora cyanea NA-134]